MTFKNQPRGRSAGFIPLGQHKNLRPRPKKDVQNFERTMAAKSGYMPNNPDNVESFTDGDRVVHRGMYGLEVRINDPTLPKVATPTNRDQPCRVRQCAQMLMFKPTTLASCLPLHPRWA